MDKVVVVDDGSTDATAEIAEALGATVVRHPMNRGYGGALQTIFKTAREMNADAMVIIDSDGQHNPEEIPKLMGPIFSGKADMVIGSRYLNGNRKNTSVYRRLGQIILDRATNLNSGLHFTDTQSGFRAFAVHTAPVFRFSQNGFSTASEMLMDATEAGLTIKEVEISVRYGEDRLTIGLFLRGLNILMSIISMKYKQFKRREIELRGVSELSIID